jgi:FKBP-type peptidyl-prolyl cis-trans isomerase FkpA
MLLLSIAACGDSTDPLTNDDFAPELGVDLDAMTQTASGLYYQDLEVGDGAEAVTGSAATVHYEGFLASGTKFDSSRDRDEPFTFAVGIGGVIAGFDEGVSGMRVGGVRKLVVPPDLAYGETGAGAVIPPNATLVFDVELLEVAQ